MTANISLVYEEVVSFNSLNVNENSTFLCGLWSLCYTIIDHENFDIFKNINVYSEHYKISMFSYHVM